MLVALLCGCTMQGDPTIAEKHLGPGAICEWRKRSVPPVCAYNGKRYECYTRGNTVQCVELVHR